MGGNPQIPRLRLVPETTFVEVPLDNEALVMLDCLVMKGRDVIPDFDRNNMLRQRQEMAGNLLGCFLMEVKKDPDFWAGLVKEVAQCNG